MTNTDVQHHSLGRRLFWSVLSLFVILAAFFIVFQQAREKEYKTDMLNLKLQDYNIRLHDALQQEKGLLNDSLTDRFVASHRMPRIRVTLIDRKGEVVYDNERKDYGNILNHSNRKEVAEALKKGSGYDISRNSHTLNGVFFYSATFFPDDNIIIRSALPYDNSLAESLQTDQHFIWFALAIMLALSAVLYRFIHRLSRNIDNLRVFARRADHNENLETEDLAEFPDDELGEISEYIIKLYLRLQHTKEEQNLLKRQLTQNIAHELKTPVASIQGYLETILQNDHINEKTRLQFLDRCYAQSIRLSSLLTDISTLNRLDDAPEMMTFEDVDIARLVSQIQQETALALQQKKMRMDNQLPESIPIRGCTSMLYSIFRNLTDNAIAYAGENTTITLRAKETAQGWDFDFSDNGVGVAPEHLARLFERFYRVDKGRSRKLGGTGLGLAIVKNAVLLHGGNIAATSNENGGICFHFNIKNNKK